ncbi:DUF4861 domain-containing protein [uncultured Bacteroides sp.]|uniref:DUF4861 domain-containing protein n=1 Tax=uncultured Bacteroides sp. TaxID=162156 RepID=UPI002AA76239|nr:DUF4861 domain-containing protein [uncultured Bacteroides sp.]
MKKYFYLLMVAFVIASCAESKTVTVTVTNPTSFDRNNEMVEVSMSEVSNKLKLADTAQVVVLNVDGQQVPYQITSDEKLIFQADVKASGVATYAIQPGTPEVFGVKACGKQYPERVDDVAWENDLIAFRTYGPALQATGEKAYGYDVWVKCCTTDPVVEARYAMELNPVTEARMDSLKKVDPKAADALRKATSYHFDHGNGFDCYNVGPTLGAGATALLQNDSIIYPYCYKTQEILDNGPLRFTVKLVYNPLTVKGDPSVVESRIITLDVGSHMNKAVVSYSNLKEVIPVATGIVLHEPNGQIVTDAKNGYITYVDPTDNANNNNGKIFVGAAFPAAVKEAKTVLFSDKEKVERKADGHILAISDYEPGSDYTYYWGAAWSKADIKDAADWNKYVAAFAQKVRNPLTVTIK